LLERSATGTELSEYHVEAGIASIHACARSAEETDWGRVVSLYDTLMSIRPSPVVALNRAIAVGLHEGPQRGLEAIRAIPDGDRLATYPFRFAALAEFELRGGRPDAARENFRQALALARNPMERRFLQRRMSACDARHPCPEARVASPS
jgi:RNA polymerase sigma-70 factor (ECF subfamily)